MLLSTALIYTQYCDFMGYTELPLEHPKGSLDKKGWEPLLEKAKLKQ